MSEYQDLVNHLPFERIHLHLVPSLWSSMDSDILKIVQSDKKWVTFKYLNPDGTLNQTGLKSIDCSKGGIYIYYVSPEIIPERQRILMYIGRAHKTPCENLRARVRSYYKFYRCEDTSRPKIRQLFSLWGPYIYCSFLEIDDNNTIDSIEKELINSLLPPCNSSIPDVSISTAVKALL